MPTTVPMLEQTHPAAATLGDFVNGRIDDAHSREIEEHLENCAECCQELARLSAQSDGFVQLVSEAGARQLGHGHHGEIPSLGETSGEWRDAGRELKSLPSGGRVGRFEILGPLGEGGFGVVFAAYDPRLRREVALKLPRLGSLLTPELRERFLREARAAAALDHPNIVPIHEAGEANNLCYIASACCRGPNLAEWLKQRNEPVPFRTAAWLIGEIAAGVEHAHSRGVLHRDLKPGNVLLEPVGENRSPDPDVGDFGFVPRISDFGLARLQNEVGDATCSHAVMGTASYMSPEQALGRSREVGPASDVYALGAILYELLTGRAPFAGDSELDTLQRVRIEEPVPPARLRPRTPSDLDTICLKCLEKEPNRRYASAGDLVADLQSFLAGRPIRARAIGSFERSSRWCRRNPALAILSGGLLAALVLIAVGSTVMSVWLNRQYHRVVDAEHTGKQHLWDSYLAGVRASLTSKTAGQRFTSLDVLRKAVQLADELKLDDTAMLTMRNEAIACLLLADLKLESQWPAAIKEMDPRRVSFDRELGRFASVQQGASVVRRVGVSADEFRWEAPGGSIQQLALSPNGQFLAAMANEDGSSQLHLWNLSAQEPLQRSLDVAQPACFCFDTATKTLGIVDQSGKIAMFDLATGDLSSGGAVKMLPLGCCFDPQGDRLAVWGGSGVDIVDLRDKRIAKQLSFPGDDQIQCASFGPDGQWLASGGSHHVVYLWHMQEPAPKYLLHGHQAWVTNVSFTPDGSLLASSSSDGTTRLWRSWSGTELVAGRGYALRFSHDGQRLGGLLGANLAIYHVAGETERRTFRAVSSPSYEALTVEVSRDGQLLATTNAGGIDLWQLDTGRQLAWLSLPKLPWLRFRQNGKSTQLLTGSEQGIHARTVSFDRASAQLEIGKPEPLELAAQLRPAFDEALSYDGGTLALLNGKGEARVLDLNGVRPPVDIHHHLIERATTSPTGKWLATLASGARGIELWDAKTGEHADSLATESPVFAASFSPDDKWLAVDTVGELILFNSGSWSIGHRLVWDGLEGLTTPRGGLSFSADSALLAVHRAGYEFRLIRAADGRVIARLPTEAPHPYVCFSPDGRRLATIGPNFTIQLWDLELIRQRLQVLGLDWR